MNSSSDSLKDGVTQNDWVEPIVLPEKPVVNEDAKDYDMDLEAIFGNVTFFLGFVTSY